MKINKIIPVILAAIIFGGIAGTVSAAPVSLTRESSVELALENNPDFQISTIGLSTAEREDRNSWNAFLPKISANVGLNGGSSLLDSQPNNMTWSFSGSLNLSMPINAGLAFSIKSIGLAYESEQISYETAQMDLISQVEKEFYYLLAVRQNLDIEQANIDLAEQRYQQDLINYDAGLASELSVLQAEVSVANLKPSYLQTVASYEARVREFLIVLGLTPEAEAEFEGSLETPLTTFDTDELIRLYLGDRQDLKTLQKNLELLQNQKKLTVANTRTPSLGLSAGWNTNVGDPFNAGSWNYTTWIDGFSVGLNLNIPLDGYIPGSSDAMNIKSLDDQIESASINLAKAGQEARTEIINLVAQLETSAASMELSELNVTLAGKSFELSEESYSRGIIQRLDVEDTQQSYLEAIQQSLVSQYEYLSGLIDLRSALGLDSLEELI